MKIITTLMLAILLIAPVAAEKEQIKIDTKEVNILPHRAFYSVKLKSSKPDSSVKDTSGRMIIELTHDCDGWTLKQESASVVDLKTLPQEVMRSVYTALESDDGKTLKFKTERVFNEKFKDSVEGTAGFTEAGGVISYKNPEDKQVLMSKGTLPPIAHMKRLIQSARAGQQSESAHVFDGSFFGNPVLIDAFIGKKKDSCDVTQLKEAVYPMNLAIYAMPSVASNPNFEIKQYMGENGIMCSYEINFGDYTVQGTLDRVEMLPNSACNQVGGKVTALAR